jgi:hypothetical protein
MTANHPTNRRAEQNADFYQPLLRKIALIATSIAERAGAQVLDPAPAAASPPAAEALSTFERAARCLRQCAAIANKIEADLRQAGPARKAANPATRRLPPNGAAVRARLERAIHTNADPAMAENLLADLYDRLEEPDILHSLARDGIEATVAILCADLGIHEPLTNLTDAELAAWVDRLDPVDDDPDEKSAAWPPARTPPANAQAPPRR